MPTRARGTRKTLVSHAATRSPRGVIKQAARDLERGLEDTDRRNTAHGRQQPRPRKRA